MKEVEIDLDNETYEKVEKYMKMKKIESFDEAFRKLVDIGLKQKEKLEKLN